MNSRSSGLMWLIVIVLLAIIIVLGYFLVATPAPIANTQATSTSSGTDTQTNTDAGTTGSSAVSVTAPKPDASVPKSFTVTGSAPGSWYFEASFPVQVRDANNNVVGTGHATALSDWMTTAQVPFTADIAVTGYSGPATLVLMKDNESGLPQNDDSMTVPIVIN